LRGPKSGSLWTNYSLNNLNNLKIKNSGLMIVGIIDYYICVLLLKAHLGNRAMGSRYDP
jgi:hypothetical protein